MNLPDALTLFTDHLEDIKTACAENLSYRLSTLAPIPQPRSPYEAELWRDLLMLEVDQLRQQYEPTIKVVVMRQQAAGSTATVGKGITPDQLEAAKAYPIEDLYMTTTGFRVRGGMGKCPFHDDNTASFSMRRFNRYRCFGCDAKGSVIDFYMRMHDCDFKTAVRALL